MKKMFFVLAASGILISCSKSYEDANFRCKINGKEFVPSTKFVHASYVSYPSNVTTLYVSGHKVAKILPAGLDGKMSLLKEFDMHPDSVGRPLTFKKSSTFLYENDKSDKSYHVDLTAPNEILIEYYEPTKGGSVRGTFHLTAKEKDGSDVLQITDGFFDVKFD